MSTLGSKCQTVRSLEATFSLLTALKIVSTAVNMLMNLYIFAENGNNKRIPVNGVDRYKQGATA